jgi:hypothetical protein
MSLAHYKAEDTIKLCLNNDLHYVANQISNTKTRIKVKITIGFSCEWAVAEFLYWKKEIQNLVRLSLLATASLVCFERINGRDTPSPSRSILQSDWYVLTTYSFRLSLSNTIFM